MLCKLIMNLICLDSEFYYIPSLCLQITIKITCRMNMFGRMNMNLAAKIRIFSNGFCIAQAINLSFYVTSALISVTTHVIANGITTSTFEKHNLLPQSFGDRTCQENSMRCCCIIRRSRCRLIQLEKKNQNKGSFCGKTDL